MTGAIPKIRAPEALPNSRPTDLGQPSDALRAGFDWYPGTRTVADLGQIGVEREAITETVVSPDGEQVGVAFEKQLDELQIWTPGRVWPASYEKAWSLRFTPDGRLMALVRVDDEWTVGIDGQLWDDRWEFAWNPKLTPDGKTIAVQIKRDMQYSLAKNGQAWSKNYRSIRDYALSSDGQHMAATAQVAELGEADIFTFLEGTWSVTVDGTPWSKAYLNTYSPCFGSDNQSVAAEVRTDICEYTIAQDGRAWDTRFGMVWRPLARPNGQFVAPTRQQGAWVLVENGKPIWDQRFVQLWHQRLSPDGQRIAAVVATAYGQWTIAVDGVPWRRTWGDLVTAPVFSPDGRRVAAAVKASDRRGIAVDGTAWSADFDMVWDPIFSPDGSHVLAKVERDGAYTLAIDGHIWSTRFDQLWDPVFSPDSQSVLVVGRRDQTVQRQVVPTTNLVG